jgi:hypothetical protein
MMSGGIKKICMAFSITIAIVLAAAPGSDWRFGSEAQAPQFQSTGFFMPVPESRPAEEPNPDEASSQDFETAGMAEINYTKPVNYATLISWYQALETKYPGYLEVFKANELYGTGIISGGYDAYYVRLTNESRGLLKPEALFVGGPHGDETAGTISMYWFCNWTLRSAFEPAYSNNMSEYVRWMLDNREIYLVASENPYGFDNNYRYDMNGWDLNRESDMDGPEPPIPAVWSSVNGKTLREFVNHHMVRVGVDFHGGARMLLYPWGSTHASVSATSTVSTKSYTYAPPDFHCFDTSSLRLGMYIGAYGGTLNSNNIGTIPTTVGYTAMGGIGPWAYGADITKNPRETAYVDQPPYPGAGALWLSPEMSTTKNPAEATFGGDNVAGWGPEVRRVILYMTDLAQPYVRMQPGSVANNSVYNPGETIGIKWQVNGSMVVDHTYVQWGNATDPVNNYSYTTGDFNANAGKYVGGTGWENATNGSTPVGVTYTQNITLPIIPGDYYFVVKAKVDQVYNGTVSSTDYDANHSYLRMLKERMQPGYSENLTGTDGVEHMQYHDWWYSDIVKVTVAGESAGIIALDEPVYRLEDIATVLVADTDLNTDNGTVQTTVVNVASTVEPAGESVTLTETGPATGAFTGALTLSATNSAGVLQVAHASIVTATYNDADNGTGPATVTDTATVDGMPPAPPTNLTVTWTGTSTITLVSQNFAGTYPPTGWSEDDPVGNSWQQYNGANAGGTAPEARFDYYDATNTWRLKCGGVDTTGYSSLTLSWRNFYDDYGTGVTVRVQTATSTSGPWTNSSWYINSGGGDVGPGIQTTTLTSNVGSSTFFFAFVVQGYAYQLDYWYIDDVLLSAAGATTDDNRLDWVKSADDGAGADDVDHYNIYRSNSQFGPWDAGHIITTVGSGVETYTDPTRGEPDGINWWYVVRAVDDIGYEDANLNAVPEIPAPQQSFNITVHVGWNLLSRPLLATDTSVPAVFTDLDGNTTWTYIQSYNASDVSDHWKTWASFRPSSQNDLAVADQKVGVWLYIPDATALGDGIIRVSGFAPVNESVQLKAGWNLVGYPSLTQRSVTDALLGLPYTSVEGYSASDPYRLTTLAGGYMMTPGEAYWIQVSSDCVWTLDW